MCDELAVRDCGHARVHLLNVRGAFVRAFCHRLLVYVEHSAQPTACKSAQRIERTCCRLRLRASIGRVAGAVWPAIRLSLVVAAGSSFALTAALGVRFFLTLNHGNALRTTFCMDADDNVLFADSQIACKSSG